MEKGSNRIMVVIPENQVTHSKR